MKKQMQGVLNGRTFFGELVLMGLLGLMCVSGSSAAEYVVVDDMESYIVAVNNIYDTWIEAGRAFINLETGDANYIRDNQSMSYRFMNTFSPYYAETRASIADLQIGSDWTGAKALVLYFRADFQNDENAIQPMFVFVSDGTETGTVEYADPNDLIKGSEGWQEWNIDLQDFADADVDLTNITEMGIIIGDGNEAGDGYVYFDDIQLYLGATATCPAGSALEFDGVNDYVEVNNPDNLNFSSSIDFTFAAWIKAETSQRKHPAIIGRRNLGNAHGYIFFLHSYEKLAVQLNDGIHSNYISTGPDLSDDTWHHVAATGDRDGYLIFYIDGVQAGQNDISGKGNIDSAANLYIGWEKRHSAVTHFNGIIDEVAIYNRALSAEEVQDNMHMRLTGNEPNLVGYWDFDEGEGQVAYDMSGNGNDGQLGSAPDIDNSDPNWVDSNAPLGICSPPFANAGPDQTVYVDSNCMTLVTLDGSDSNGPDGDELTYSWFMDGVEVAAGVSPTIELSLGEYVIELIVNDGFDDSEPDEVVITVLDNTPPELSLSVEPNILWPPNGKMTLVTPEWEVSDNCDDEVEVSLVDIMMSAEGDVNDYVQISDDGSIYLRARKGEGGSGRIYTIMYQAVDDSGNVTEESTTVTVPHRR